MSSDPHGEVPVFVLRDDEPESWRDLVSEKGLQWSIRGLITQAQHMAGSDQDAVVVYAEFALHLGSDGVHHVFGLFAELDAPEWVDRQFAFHLLREVHAQLAKDTGCRCAPRVVIVTKGASYAN